MKISRTRWWLMWGAVQGWQGRQFFLVKLIRILSLKLGAKLVVFQDYNKETYEQALKRQLDLNLDEDQQAKQTKFVSGSWDTISLVDCEMGKDWIQQVDVAIASEVIYRESSYPSLTSFLVRILKPGGRCIMVNKEYYFGVGGSMEAFKGYIQQCGQLKIVNEIEVNTKKTNKKSIVILVKI